MTNPGGIDPVISVLMCSRGRPEKLCNAVDSLFSLACRPQDLEVLIKVDDDDPGTIAVTERMARVAPVRAFVSPRGRGYRDNHLWLEGLAREARGDWLFVFNDDARIHNEGWDLTMSSPGIDGKMISWPDGIILLIPNNLLRPGSHELFIVRRKVFEVLGHLSLSPHADTWLITVLMMVQRALHCEVTYRPGDPGFLDPTAAASKGVQGDTVRELCSPAMIRAKLADAEKLVTYMEAYENRSKT